MLGPGPAPSPVVVVVRTRRTPVQLMFRIATSTVAVLIGLTLSAEGARACSVCLPGDPTFTNLGASSMEPGTFSIYTEYRSFKKKSGLLPHGEEEEHHDEEELLGDVGHFGHVEDHDDEPLVEAEEVREQDPGGDAAG